MPKDNKLKNTSNSKTASPRLKIEMALHDIATDEVTLRLSFDALSVKSKKIDKKSIDIVRSELGELPALYRKLLALGYRGTKTQMNKQIESLIVQLPENSSSGTWKTGQFKGALVTRFSNLCLSESGGEKVELINPNGSRPKKSESNGTVEGYLKGIESHLENSTELTFAYLMSLLAPLGVLLGIEDGFVGIAYGKTNSGKSTLAKVAQSTFTKATSDTDLDGYENTLGRRLISTIQTAGLVRCFGDLKSNRDGVSFQDLRTIGYSVAEGRFRQAMDDTSDEISLQFSTQLYAAEIPLWEMASKKGEKFEFSDLVRLIHIPIEKPMAGGIFRKIEQAKVSKCYDKLDAALRANYGVIMPVWLSELDQMDMGKLKKSYQKWMKKRYGGDADYATEQIRIARIFRRLEFVAKLAYRTGVLPIDYQVAKKNLREQFERTIACGPRSEPHVNKLTKTVTDILWAAACFPVVTQGVNASYDINSIGGFKRQEPDGKTYLFVHSSFLERFEKKQEEKVRDILKELSGQDETKHILQSGIEKRQRYYIIPVCKLYDEAHPSSNSDNELSQTNE